MKKIAINFRRMSEFKKCMIEFFVCYALLIAFTYCLGKIHINFGKIGAVIFLYVTFMLAFYKLTMGGKHDIG